MKKPNNRQHGDKVYAALQLCPCGGRHTVHKINNLLNDGYRKTFTRWSASILLLATCNMQHATFNIYAPPVSADSSSPLLTAYYDNFLKA